MEIIWDGNKIFAKICEINSTEYLQKIDVYSKDFKKHVRILTSLDSSLLALSNHPKINTAN